MFLTTLTLIYRKTLLLTKGTLYPIDISCDDQLSHTSSSQHYYLSHNCLIKRYSAKDAEKCLRNQTLVFMGDSRARNLFLAARILFGLSNLTDYSLKFHNSEYDVFNMSGIPDMTYIFDPYINSSAPVNQSSRIIVSSGLWYLKNIDPFELAYNQFVGNIDNAISTYKNATSLTIKLIAPVIEEDLDASRRDKLKNSEIMQLNRYLRDISPITSKFPLVPESMNAMYELTQKASSDGVHYPYSLVSEELNVYLNAICNRIIYTGNKVATTCCTEAYTAKFTSLALPWCMILAGCFLFFYSRRCGKLNILNA